MQQSHLNLLALQTSLVRLYWMNRIGIAFIWIWTAYVSWFIYPQAQSLDWLRRIGLNNYTYIWFAASCLVDVGMGIASLFFPSKMLWKCQILIVLFYSVVILIGLPEFFIHPFSPIIKNIAILCSLYLLVVSEGRM
jgi:hypothetical protein